jgi:dTDP-4-amino-4,6-dideoxy-D-galactose acyltransferase
MLQVPFDIAEDRESVADLLRNRCADGHEPPLVCAVSDASLEREIGLLSSDRSFGTVIRNGREALGVACWTHLEWDSEQLGMPAARVDLLVSAGGYQEALERKTSLLRTAVEECRLRGVRYLTARVSAADLSTVHALARSGFDLVDGILTFSMTLGQAGPRTARGDLELRPFEPGDLEQILAIARDAYTCDRFHADRSLPEGIADRLYAAWVRRCCSGEEADAVVVAARNGRVLAYVTCKIVPSSGREGTPRAGSIGLVATAGEARGQGIARAALDGALDWFRTQNVHTVEVGTQMQNMPACRLYEQNGFRMSRMGLTYRRLL